MDNGICRADNCFVRVPRDSKTGVCKKHYHVKPWCQCKHCQARMAGEEDTRNIRVARVPRFIGSHSGAEIVATAVSVPAEPWNHS